MKRRIFAFLLAVSMIVSLLPVMAFANETTSEAKQITLEIQDVNTTVDATSKRPVITDKERLVAEPGKIYYATTDATTGAVTAFTESATVPTDWNLRLDNTKDPAVLTFKNANINNTHATGNVTVGVIKVIGEGSIKFHVMSDSTITLTRGWGIDTQMGGDTIFTSDVVNAETGERALLDISCASGTANTGMIKTTGNLTFENANLYIKFSYSHATLSNDAINVGGNFTIDGGTIEIDDSAQASRAITVTGNMLVKNGADLFIKQDPRRYAIHVNGENFEVEDASIRLAITTNIASTSWTVAPYHINKMPTLDGTLAKYYNTYSSSGWAGVENKTWETLTVTDPVANVPVYNYVYFQPCAHEGLSRELCTDAATCGTCGKVFAGNDAHAPEYAYKDGAVHTVTCANTGCAYSVEEAHNIPAQEGAYVCTQCGPTKFAQQVVLSITDPDNYKKTAHTVTIPVNGKWYATTVAPVMGEDEEGNPIVTNADQVGQVTPLGLLDADPGNWNIMVDNTQPTAVLILKDAYIVSGSNNTVGDGIGTIDVTGDGALEIRTQAASTIDYYRGCGIATHMGEGTTYTSVEGALLTIMDAVKNTAKAAIKETVDDLTFKNANIDARSANNVSYGIFYTVDAAEDLVINGGTIAIEAKYSGTGAIKVAGDLTVNNNADLFVKNQGAQTAIDVTNAFTIDNSTVKIWNTNSVTEAYVISKMPNLNGIVAKYYNEDSDKLWDAGLKLEGWQDLILDPGTPMTDMTHNYWRYSFAAEVAEEEHTHTEATRDENVTDATCGVAGSKTVVTYCSECNEVLGSEVVEIPATNVHTEATREEVTKEATCGAAGTKNIITYCSECTEVLKTEPAEIPATNAHTEATREEVTKEATCGAAGTKNIITYCSVCNNDLKTEPAEIPATNAHTEKTREVVTTDATCGVAGSKNVITYCDVCDKVLGEKTEEIAATGKHVTATREEVTKEAACGVEGSKNVITYCTVCNDDLNSETVAIPALEHDTDGTGDGDYIPPSCSEPGLEIIIKTCSKCGEVSFREEKEIPATGDHIYETLVEVKHPTCVSVGYEIMKCGCGKERTVELPIGGAHAEPYSYEDNRVEPTCVKDGSYDMVTACRACGVEMNRVPNTIPATNVHTETTREEVITNATCGAAGTKNIITYCSVCNNDLFTNEEGIPATGAHTYKDKFDADCDVCGQGREAATPVAQIGDRQFETLAEAIKEAAENDTIKLVGTVVLGNDGVEFNKTLTLDLNGQTITSVGDAIVVSAGTLTIDNSIGEGKVIAGTAGVGDWVAVWAVGGKVIILDGTYSCGGDTAAPDMNHQNDVIYAKGGLIEIYGGTVEYTEGVWAVNENDSFRGTLKVYGGKFENFDPADSIAQEKGDPSFVADGKHTTTEGAYFVICTSEVQTTEETNRVDATCTENGSYTLVTKCSCGKVLSTVTETIVAAGSHTEATRDENVVGATCGAAGSKTVITYCTVCNNDLKSENVVIPATGEHNLIAGTPVAPTYNAKGYTLYTCDACNYKERRDLVNTLFSMAKNETTGEYYSTLQDAINLAGENDIITLTVTVKDVATIIVPTGKKITINLNECSYAVGIVENIIEKAALIVEAGAEVTLTGNGTLAARSVSGNKDAFDCTILNKGTLIVKNATVNANNLYAADFAIINAGDLTLEAGAAIACMKAAALSNTGTVKSATEIEAEGYHWTDGILVAHDYKVTDCPATCDRVAYRVYECECGDSYEEEYGEKKLPAVAKIGDKLYASMEEAIAAVPEGAEGFTEIVLVKTVKDVKTIVVPAGKKVKINLNGFSYAVGNIDNIIGKAALIVEAGAEVILTGNGTLAARSVSGNKDAFDCTVLNNGTLIVENAAVNANNLYATDFAIINAGDLTLEAGAAINVIKASAMSDNGTITNNSGIEF